MPSVPSMSFNVRFNLASAPTLALTDATTYPVGAIGIFTITQPDGYVRTGNFSSPDVSSSGGTLSTPLRLSSTGGVQCGTYTIKYEIRTTDLVISTFTREFIFTYVPVSLSLKENFDVFTPSLSYSDMTSYGVNNYSNISPTRAWTANSIPTGTKTSNTSTISLQHNGKYYDAVYTISLASTLTYQHTTYAWLSVLETVSKTVVAEACTPEPLEDLIAMMETLRQNSINCAGDLPIFEKAQSLFSHLMDQVKMAILNNIPQDGIYDTYEDLMAILRNSQPCVHTNLPIDPYDLGDYAVSPFPLDLSYCDLIGDGYNTTYTVNHNLNDDCVIVQVYESLTGAQVLCDVTVSDNNNVVASFYTAPTTDQYKVVVYAGARGQIGPGVAAGGGIGQFLVKGSLADYDTQWITPAFASNTRTLTINGLTQDLTADRSWTIDTLYNKNGALTGDRIVTMGAFTLSFEKDIRVNGLTVGKGNSSIVSNTAVGINVLLNINTLFGFGNFNSAFGYESMKAITGGSTNTASGSLSLSSATTASFNTAIGSASLNSLINGNWNTGIGRFSLVVTTGSNNTAIGGAAGYGAGVNANTSGSNNIFIGYQSVGVSATESNRTWIGNSSTTSTWLGGNLLLGSTTDTGLAKLQVTGAIQQSSVLSSLLKTDGSGVLVAATLGTDYSVLPTQTGNTGKFLTTNGSVLSWADVVSGVSSFNTRTGDVVLNSSDVTTALGYTPVTNARTLTINGTAYDLSADRSWTVSDTNIYTVDGTLAGDRIVSSGGFSLTLNPNLSIGGSLINPTSRTKSTAFDGTGATSVGNSFLFHDYGLAFTGNTNQYHAGISKFGRIRIERTSGTGFSTAYGETLDIKVRGLETASKLSTVGYYASVSRDDASDIAANSSTFINGFTASLDHYATSGTGVMYTQQMSGYASTLYNVSGGVINMYHYKASASIGTASNSKGNPYVTNYYGVQLDTTIGSTSGTHTSVIENFYGVFIGSPTVRANGSIINRWGVYAPDIAMRHYLNGNLLLGTVTDTGLYKLDVNGTARVSGDATINGSVIANGGGSGVSYFIANATAIRGSSGTTLFYIDGNPSLTGTINIRSTSVIVDGTFQCGTANTGDLNGGTISSVSAQPSIRLNKSSNIWFIEHSRFGTNTFEITNNIGAIPAFTIASNNNIGVGVTTPNASALVDIASTTKGFLPPRMTEAQKNAISSPASGLIIYQTDGVEGLYVRTSTTWRTLIMA